VSCKPSRSWAMPRGSRYRLPLCPSRRWVQVSDTVGTAQKRNPLDEGAGRVGHGQALSDASMLFHPDGRGRQNPDPSAGKPPGQFADGHAECCQVPKVSTNSRPPSWPLASGPSRITLLGVAPVFALLISIVRVRSSTNQFTTHPRQCTCGGETQLSRRGPLSSVRMGRRLHRADNHLSFNLCECKWLNDWPRLFSFGCEAELTTG